MSEKIRIVVVNDPVIITGSSGGGSGTIIGGVNGLTTVGNKIKFGGILNEPTALDTAGNLLTFGTNGTSVTNPNARLQFSVLGGNSQSIIFQSLYNSSAFADFRVNATSANTFFTLQSSFNSGSNLRRINGNTNVNGITITDTSGKGLYYAANYGSTFENRSLPDVGYVTGLTSGFNGKLITLTGTTLPTVYQTKAGIVTLTGSTLPNTYLTRSIYATYTGTTARLTYQTRSGFNTLTGSTLPLTYQSKASIVVLTGTTLPATYQTRTVFNSYTGTTNTRVTAIENNYITGYTSLGNHSLITTKNGRNLRFKGLAAGTNITLTPTATGITISASGGGGALNGATNGLRLSGGGSQVALGGSLTGDTNLTIGGNIFTVTGTSGFVRSSNGGSTLHVRGRGTTNGSLIRFENSTGGTEFIMNDSGATTFFGKTKFTPTTTLAGLNVGAVTATPTQPQDGDIWYNSTGIHLGIRVGGSNQMAMRTQTGANGTIPFTAAAGSSFFNLSTNFSWDNTNNVLSASKLALGNTTTYTAPTNGAIVYSGSTNAFQFRENGVWNSYLNRSSFNSYSASTASNISAKLNTSTFNSFTASTGSALMITRVVGSNTSVSNSDLGKTIEVTGSTNRTVTITYSGVSNGFQCNINNLMASNTVTLVAGPGTTLQLTGTVLATQYAGASIYVSGTNVRGFGNLS